MKIVKKHNSFYKILKLSFVALAVTILYSSNVSADMLSCTPQTVVKDVPGKGKIATTVPECPDGSKSRNDINVKCMLGQAAKNSCIDIVPAQDKSKLVRIPEDVCFRGEGWGNKRNHNGMDYAVPGGSGVTAAADGVVEFAGTNCPAGGGNGTHVKIKHQLGGSSGSSGEIVPSPHTSCFYTYYLHLSGTSVRTGQRVKKGDLVGMVGGTGCKGSGLNTAAYPPHLHFEMRTCSGAIINPMCPDLGDLCPGGAGNKDDADPNKCRDCVKNAAACNNTGYSGSDLSGGGSVEDAYVPQSDSPDKECKITYYSNSFTVCIFCEIFRVLFDTASVVCAKSFAALSPAVSYVLIMATAIWLAFTVLKYVSAFETKEPRAMIKEILSQLTLVLFILAILSMGPGEFFNWTLGPIFNTGMKLAIMTSTNPDALLKCSDFTVKTMAEGGGLPEDMGINILCVVKTIQDSFLDILALGMTALCIGFFEQSFWNIPIFPHFGYVLTGLGLVIAALLILIIYPWLLIDSVLKLSVAVALLPAAIGAYAYKMTRKYVSKVWETFLNSMFTFMFLSIILFVLIKMIDDTIKEADIMELMNDTVDPQSILDKMGWWTATFLQVCFAILLGWAVLGEGSTFANDFAGGMGFSQNIGSNVGTTAMSGAKGVAAPVAKSAAKVGGKAASAVGNTVKEKANSAKLSMQASSIKNSKNSTVNADGSVTQKYTNWRGKEVSRTLNIDASGNKSVSKEKTDKKGNTTTTTTDKFMSSTVTKDKNGNITKENMEMKAAGAKYLINKDGTMNQVAINAMMQNSLHDKETVQKAIAMQVMKERFGDEKALSGNFASRDIKMSVDKKGNNVFEMVQKNKDGSTQKVSMTMGDKRILIGVEDIDKKGNSSFVSSDGIINKTRTCQYDKEGNVKEKSLKENYSFTDNYNRSTRAVDSLGTFAKWVPADEIMHSEEDIQKLTKQVAKYGRPEQTQGLNVKK